MIATTTCKACSDQAVLGFDMKTCDCAFSHDAELMMYSNIKLATPIDYISRVLVYSNFHAITNIFNAINSLFPCKNLLTMTLGTKLSGASVSDPSRVIA